MFPTQDDFECDLTGRCRDAVRATVQVVLDEELERPVGASRYEQSDQRVDVRNGSYQRRVVTTSGEVALRVGRTRAGGSATAPLGRYARRRPELDAAITQAYVGGVSIRDMAAVTEALLDKARRALNGESRDQTPRRRGRGVAPGADHRAGAVPDLDATFIDARWARSVEIAAALVAYGIGTDGHRPLLSVHIGAQEAEASWAEVLSELVARGLSGVRLVVRDEHAGIIAAARKILPEVRQQRCTVHLMRNVFSHVPQRHQKRLARELVAVLHTDSLAAAKRNLCAFRDRFARQFPEAVACLERGFVDATSYFAFPEEHWMRIRSTNGLERLHGEIERRTRAVGAFPDRASALRLVTAVALQATTIWRDRIYLDVSLLDDHYAAAA